MQHDAIFIARSFVAHLNSTKSIQRRYFQDVVSIAQKVVDRFEIVRVPPWLSITVQR